MHTGVLPGYAASYGCIRLPNSFAARLWKITKLGTRGIVARHGLQPAPITHAKLDLLKRKPAEATPLVEGATGKTMVTERPVATDGAGDADAEHHCHGTQTGDAGSGEAEADHQRGLFDGTGGRAVGRA